MNAPILKKGFCPYCGQRVNARCVNAEVGYDYYPPCFECMLRGREDIRHKKD